MNDFAALIDKLPPPQIPDSFSGGDRQLILMLLEDARQQVRPYDGKFEAPWLLTPFESDIWETTNRSREELVDGTWKNTVRVDWRVKLPNGSLLTDERYKLLLNFTKKIMFLMRSGLICGASAPDAWLKSTYQLIRFVRWIILHEQRFQPEKYCMGLIDQPAVDWLFGLVADGGWAHALQLPQRSLAAMYRGAHGATCPHSLLDDPFAVPPSEIHPIKQWVESQGGYCSIRNGAHEDKRHINRAWLSGLIYEGTFAISTPRMKSFCRQFEPDYRSHVIEAVCRSTEFPSQSAEVVSEVSGSASEKVILHLATSMGSILEAHRHIPDLLPEPASLSLRRARNLANRIARSSGHTPFMPVNTGLAYLNTAIRFVHLYGEAIIGLYLTVISICKRSGGGTTGQNAALKRHANDWCIASGEPITTVLNITEFCRYTKKRDFNRLRSNPSLDHALRVLIGSCIVCMAILKPSREDELTHLKRNCLRRDANGYGFNYDLGKSNVKGVEARQEADRPIPVISAKAIQLLQHLGEGLSEILGENSKAADNLFYLPTINGDSALQAKASLLNRHLDIFCDFVGLPPDSEGRRWYVRIHEMRKWFLLLLFWSGRFDVLDAARWIAGHTDAAHIYAYIEKEFPGEELPQIEAQYSEDRLRRLELGDSGHEDGANALYEAVLRHFNVESISMIPEAEWTGYVRALREADKFHLEPHSIRNEDGSVVGINVSFVMRELP